MIEEGVAHVEGWASHCRCGWRGPVRNTPLRAEEDGAQHECRRALGGDKVEESGVEHCRYSTKGCYDTKAHAKLARRQYLDDPDGPEPEYGPYYRVCYLPTSRYPGTPYALLAFQWKEDADLVNIEGEIQ